RDSLAASATTGVPYTLTGALAVSIDPCQDDRPRQRAGMAGPGDAGMEWPALPAEGRRWRAGTPRGDNRMPCPLPETFAMNPPSSAEPARPVIPVIVLDDAADAVPLAHAVRARGLDMPAATLRP